MKHAGEAALGAIQPMLTELRQLEGIRERSPEVFGVHSLSRRSRRHVRGRAKRPRMAPIAGEHGLRASSVGASSKEDTGEQIGISTWRRRALPVVRWLASLDRRRALSARSPGTFESAAERRCGPLWPPAPMPATPPTAGS